MEIEISGIEFMGCRSLAEVLNDFKDLLKDLRATGIEVQLRLRRGGKATLAH